MNELLLLRLALLMLGLLETLGKSQYTDEQRKEIREARKAAMKAMREQE